MSRLAACFETLKNTSRTALIPYVMTADPHPQITLPLLHAMVDAGADIIELGAPFSDPMADGPVIQAAAERSLAHNTSLHDVFSVVREFRKENDTTPIIMMGYLNPIEVMGYASFAEQAAAAGIDGVITVDMPPVEAGDYVVALEAQKIDPVFLLAPTSTAERIRKLASVASGFVYYVSLKGVTGAATLDVSSVEQKLNEIKQFIDLPIGVGFGISNAEAAAKVAACADAVVVGSVLVKKMADCSNHSSQESARIIKEISDILSAMRRAMDAG
ncbi:MAG TPA: tryptophan synthase subunit alpha [Thiotrichales bacterium]|nr:tryptophan synthase subunit alpha [Thiotrichales bacterium]